MTPLNLASTSLPGSDPSDSRPRLARVFLLSPANTSAIRGQLLLNRNSEFELARRIRRRGAPLGELFSFISSPLFSRQARLCGSLFAIVDRFSFDTRYDVVPGSSAASDRDHFRGPCGNVGSCHRSHRSSIPGTA